MTQSAVHSLDLWAATLPHIDSDVSDSYDLDRSLTSALTSTTPWTLTNSYRSDVAMQEAKEEESLGAVIVNEDREEKERGEERPPDADLTLLGRSRCLSLSHFYSNSLLLCR